MPDARSAPFQAIVFDLGGVLVAHDNRVMFDRIASRCSAPFRPERLEVLLRNPAWMTGTPLAELHGRVQRDLGYRLDFDTFAADWCCHFTLDPSMVDFVQRLSAHNRVMLFSNTQKEHWEFVDGLAGGALRKMEAYLSHEIGQAKPTVRAFEVVAEKAGIEPGRSIFFDDLIVNVQGARRAGFQSEVFIGEVELAALLADRGVVLG